MKRTGRKTIFPRFLLAAGASGSGKTLITCGILQALKNRGLTVSSFKCGPDYIDPMFHEKVLHTKSRNLDTFFAGEEMTRYLFAKNAASADVSVIEGVMGYYDGLGGITEKAGAYDLACAIQAPAVLIVDAKGMSLSAAAYIRGFLTFREDSRIRGVILNRISPMLYPKLKECIEQETGVRVYGYVPKMTDCVIESRHLGLVTPGEITELEEKLQKLAGVLEETLEIDALLELAAQAEAFPEEGEPASAAAGDVSGRTDGADIPEGLPARRTAAAHAMMPPALQKVLESARAEKVQRTAPVLAVARDEAFCFLYEDNLQLLRELGVRIREFSPMRDTALPKDADGVLLCGGYPELYAKVLSGNRAMLEDIREKTAAGLPCMAECGGFMYLHRSMEDMEGTASPMAGVIDARAFRTQKLTRFGYIELEERKTDLAENEKKPKADENAGEAMRTRAHEFHYFDSTDNGEAFIARKPMQKREWNCIHKTDTLFAGFPHLYYYSSPEIALRFAEKCAACHRERNAKN